ncbi:unnamed protein product [Moneuplotes crassus]|uniref:RING-type domain-containing protein n=1 Tax=Euplotes crassus TaxID=5936 RepID=A0AAD1UJV8_EUPCR|nr:unnamed protein product [Moneuplotes crassus]
MECSICFEGYLSEQNVPKILTICGHTYCNTCLGHLQKCDKVLCPLCHQEMYVTCIDELPTNYALLEAIRAFDNLKTQLEIFQKSNHSFNAPGIKTNEPLLDQDQGNRLKWAGDKDQSMDDTFDFSERLDTPEQDPEEQKFMGNVCFPKDKQDHILPPLRAEGKRKSRLAEILKLQMKLRKQERICKFCDFENEEGYARCFRCHKPKRRIQGNSANSSSSISRPRVAIPLIKGSYPPGEDIIRLINHDNRIWYCRSCNVVNKFKKICILCKVSKEDKDYKFPHCPNCKKSVSRSAYTCESCHSSINQTSIRRILF